ncbi:MAG: ORF6N domain-containing protein [bacterium]
MKLPVSRLEFSDIRSHIHNIRGVQVMLDEDLAILYGVTTKRLNEQVKRNRDRFPDQFCFQITKDEYQNLKSQIATSNQRSQFATFEKEKRRKYLPYSFTEQGVAMLSGVLKSDVAVRVSIQIMSEFVAMRKMVGANAQLFTRLDIIEQKQLKTDAKINQVLDALAGQDVIPKQKLFFEGTVFDAHLFVAKLIRSAKKEIILIDNFINEEVFTLFIKRNEGVIVTIYCDNISSELALDLKKFNSEYSPITLNKFSGSHDRFLIIDHENIYHFGASVKDLGKKWFAVSKLETSSVELLRRL